MLTNHDGGDIGSGANKTGYGSALALVISGAQGDLRRPNESVGT